MKEIWVKDQEIRYVQEGFGRWQADVSIILQSSQTVQLYMLTKCNRIKLNGTINVPNSINKMRYI